MLKQAPSKAHAAIAEVKAVWMCLLNLSLLDGLSLLIGKLFYGYGYPVSSEWGIVKTEYK